MQHPNALLMRKVDDALLAGDFPGFLALHVEDVVMHIPGRGPLAGDHVGRDGLAAVFQRELAMLDAPPEMVVLDDLGSDDHAASVVIQRMRRGERSYEGLQFVLARVRDGQLSEVGSAPKIRMRSTRSSPRSPAASARSCRGGRLRSPDLLQLSGRHPGRGRRSRLRAASTVARAALPPCVTPEHVKPER